MPLADIETINCTSQKDIDATVERTLQLSYGGGDPPIFSNNNRGGEGGGDDSGGQRKWNANLMFLITYSMIGFAGFVALSAVLNTNHYVPQTPVMNDRLPMIKTYSQGRPRFDLLSDLIISPYTSKNSSAFEPCPVLPQLRPL
jgi:hypothetical protein